MRNRDVVVDVELAVRGDVTDEEVSEFIRQVVEAAIAADGDKFMFNGDCVTAVRPGVAE